MAYGTSGFGGFIVERMKETVNTELLFNTNDLNKEQKTSAFLVNPPATLNSGTTDECGGIPVECVTPNQFDVTANHPLNVNKVFSDCDYEDLSSEAVVKYADSVAKVWSAEINRYAYEQMLPEFEDVTANADVAGAVNVKSQIIEVLKLATTAGYSKSDLLVAVSESVELDLDDLDVQCCDLGVQQQNSTQSLKNKLGVELYSVPVAQLSGGQPTDATEAVKFVVYVREYARVKEYCKNLPVMRRLQTDKYLDNAQVIGKMEIGADYVNSENGLGQSIAEGSAYVVYEEAPVSNTPQKTTKKVTKTEK